MSFKLRRTRQCSKCPWKKSTNPHDIPNGYCERKHLKLSSTIADESGNLAAALGFRQLRHMACHEHPEGAEAHCVGWLVNQLGPGNNIALRLVMRSCDNLANLSVDGPQHETFEDTLPHPESIAEN